jgi:two-component system CheB/CheR fusion protein
MPKSAVATGLVDKVLKVQPCRRHPRLFRTRPGQCLQSSGRYGLSPKVCDELRQRLGHDFSQYKRSTMLRRIQRRMQVIGASDGERYLDWLRNRVDEADLLFRDLLINVTCFFRDSEYFDYLRREVIPALLQGRGAGDTIGSGRPAVPAARRPTASPF